MRKTFKNGRNRIHPFLSISELLIYYSIVTQEDFSFNLSTKRGKKINDNIIPNQPISADCH